MSENYQSDVDAQRVFTIKPKTMVLGRPVYHVKESRGDADPRVLAVCPWLEDAERIARALSQFEGGIVRVVSEDETEAIIEEGESAPHVVVPGSVQAEQPQAAPVAEAVDMAEPQPPTDAAQQGEPPEMPLPDLSEGADNGIPPL